jgi:hypothetical protein
MDGRTVNGVGDLQALVQQAQPGQDVPLTLLHNGKQAEVPVILGERPAPTPTPQIDQARTRVIPQLTGDRDAVKAGPSPGIAGPA